MFKSNAYFQELAKTWYTPIICVDPDHQGKGYGSMLVEKTLERVRTDIQLNISSSLLSDQLDETLQASADGSSVALMATQRRNVSTCPHQNQIHHSCRAYISYLIGWMVRTLRVQEHRRDDDCRTFHCRSSLGKSRHIHVLETCVMHKEPIIPWMVKYHKTLEVYSYSKVTRSKK